MAVALGILTASSVASITILGRALRLDRKAANRQAIVRGALTEKGA